MDISVEQQQKLAVAIKREVAARAAAHRALRARLQLLGLARPEQHRDQELLPDLRRPEGRQGGRRDRVPPVLGRPGGHAGRVRADRQAGAHDRDQRPQPGHDPELLPAGRQLLRACGRRPPTRTAARCTGRRRGTTTSTGTRSAAPPSGRTGWSRSTPRPRTFTVRDELYAMGQFAKYLEPAARPGRVQRDRRTASATSSSGTAATTSSRSWATANAAPTHGHASSLGGKSFVADGAGRGVRHVPLERRRAVAAPQPRARYCADVPDVVADQYATTQVQLSRDRPGPRPARLLRHRPAGRRQPRRDAPGWSRCTRPPPASRT